MIGPVRDSSRKSPNRLVLLGRLALIPMLATFLMASAIGCNDRGPEASLHRADELAFQGRYEEAVFLLDEMIASLRNARGKEAEALRLEAIAKAARYVHLFQRRPEQALSYYRRIAELSPGSDEAFDARQRMAKIHLESNDRPAAISQYQALVAGFSSRENVDQFQYALARSYFAMGDMEQSRTEGRYLLRHWPDSDYADRVRMLIATTHQVQGQMEEALEAFKSAREKTDDADLEVRALFEEAGCLASLEREEEAMAAYTKALGTHPEPRLVRMRMKMLEERMSRRGVENLGTVW